MWIQQNHPDYKQSTVCTYRSNYQTHGRTRVPVNNDLSRMFPLHKWTTVPVNNDLSRMFPQHMWTSSIIFMLIIKGKVIKVSNPVRWFAYFDDWAVVNIIIRLF